MENVMYIAGDIVVYKGSSPEVHKKLKELGHLAICHGFTYEYHIFPQHQIYVQSNEFKQAMKASCLILPWTSLVKKYENMLGLTNNRKQSFLTHTDLHLGGTAAWVAAQ